MPIVPKEMTKRDKVIASEEEHDRERFDEMLKGGKVDIRTLVLKEISERT